MLFAAGRLDELEAYVAGSDDKELLKWWAQYCESNGRFERASALYSRARDHLSLVRVLCYNGEFGQAAEVVASSGSQAAAFHLARQLEGNGNVRACASACLPSCLPACLSVHLYAGYCILAADRGLALQLSH